jgi:crotonobetainyl-CoA hydratase
VGGDISAMVDAKTEDDYKVPDSGYGGLTNRFSCDKPVIGAVNGLALGAASSWPCLVTSYRRG